MANMIKVLFVWHAAVNLSDSALESLLGVLKKILCLINFLITSEKLAEIIDVFPGTLYKTRKLAGINRDHFEKYVVCPKCDETYKYKEAFKNVHGL